MKEGGFDTLLEVALIVLVGALVSNIVCALLWPQRATKNLHTTMAQTLDSFSTVLKMITQTFLLEEESLLLVNQEKLDKATKDHQGSFTKLKKDLGEAESEWFAGGPARPASIPSSSSTTSITAAAYRGHLGQAYEDAVDSLNRLGQHLNGLRSGISVQFELIKASKDGKLTLRNRKQSQGTPTVDDKYATINSINEDPEDTALLQAAADAFGDLIEDLGPPLRALSVSLYRSHCSVLSKSPFKLDDL